jgi:hypothetical protein
MRQSPANENGAWSASWMCHGSLPPSAGENRRSWKPSAGMTAYVRLTRHEPHCLSSVGETAQAHESPQRQLSRRVMGSGSTIRPISLKLLRLVTRVIPIWDGMRWTLLAVTVVSTATC